MRFTCATFVTLLAAWSAHGQTVSVEATAETDPTPLDSADDPAIWIHPTDPSLSLVIGTDKSGGLVVYDLAGQQLQFIPGGQPNNVDVRYGFPFDGGFVDVVGTGDRSDDTIALYRVDPDRRQLVELSTGSLLIGVDTYGFALHRSCLTGKFYAFVSGEHGGLEQHELFDDGNGSIGAVVVRSFDVGGITEGLVADDPNGVLYAAEEEIGIWRYGAEPDAGSERVSVDTTGVGGHLTADVEGLTIYHAPDGAGYLIASSQGSNEFVIYERAGRNGYLLTFEIVSGANADGCSSPDGIDVTNLTLGGAYPNGLFVAHDDNNSGGAQNYKLVDWSDLVEAAAPTELIVDTSWDPRLCDVTCQTDLDRDGETATADLL
ncbi:MAG: phytase, partial [Planctomycetota bacterium]